MILFLKGIGYLSKIIQSSSTEKLKKIVEKFTSNKFNSILVGLFLTILIQSSSATTAILISLISAKVINLKQALPLIMGANIGTTFTSFVIIIDMDAFSLYFILIGIIFLIFIKKPKFIFIAKSLISIGIIFQGLFFIKYGVSFLTNETYFVSLISTQSKNNMLMFISGIVFTGLIQSSSATLIIVQNLFDKDLLSLKPALFIIIGSNIGTTLTILIASISNMKQAKQLALFHILFNVLGSIFFILMIDLYILFLSYVDNFVSLDIIIAISHLIFNIILVIIFSPFLKSFENLINTFIKT